MEKPIKLDKDDATPFQVYVEMMAREARDYPKDGCLPCGAVIRMGFFFDAFGRHRDIDDPTSSQYSAICRLWEAHGDENDRKRRIPIRAKQFWYPFYYSGLGTPLNKDAELSTWKEISKATLKLGAKQVLNTTKNAAESVARVKAPLEQANVGKQLQGAIKDAASEFSFRPVVKVYEDFKQNVEKAPQTVARVRNILAASPERIWERTKASGIVLYRSLKKDLMRNPLKALQALQAAARQLFVNVAAENVPIVRDNALMAKAFGTGVEARIEAAMEQFRAAFDEVRMQMPNVRRIEVAVFGADRGCVLARVFVNRLATKYKGTHDQHLVIEGVEIELKFLGLFDAVSSIMSEEAGMVVGMIPFLGTVQSDYEAQQLAVPASVQKTVHFAAAHELRFYQRLDSLENTRGEQKLFPGTSSDVVGGEPSSSLGFHAELMRVPLQEMLVEAVRAGAALDLMEDLAKYKNKTFEKFTLALPITHDGKEYRIKALVNEYRQLARGGSKLDFAAHSKVFLRWIAARYQDPHFPPKARDPMRDWMEQAREADGQRKAAKARLDWEMRRQGVTMSLLSTRSAADQAKLRELKANSDAAQQHYETLIAAAPKQEFTSVWQRLDQEARELTARWEKIEPEYEAEKRRQLQRPLNQPPSYTPLFLAPAFARHTDLTEEQIELVKAWQKGASGDNPLPEPVMKLFDLLVHDTLLTSWHDHVLAPTLYFRTRGVDKFGETDYAKEEKQRIRDEKAAARAAQIGEAMTPASRGPYNDRR